MADKNLFNNMGFAKNTKTQQAKPAYSYEKLKNDLLKALEDTKNTGPVKVRRKVEYIEEEAPPKPAKTTAPNETSKPAVINSQSKGKSSNPTITPIGESKNQTKVPLASITEPKVIAEVKRVSPAAPSEVKRDEILPPVTVVNRIASADRQTRGKIIERSTSPIVVRRVSLSQPTRKPHLDNKRASIPADTSPKYNRSRRPSDGRRTSPRHLDYLSKDPLDEADPLKYWILNGRKDDLGHIPHVFKLPDARNSRERTFDRIFVSDNRKNTPDFRSSDDQSEADEFKNWVLNGRQDFHKLNNMIQFHK